MSLPKGEEVMIGETTEDKDYTEMVEKLIKWVSLSDLEEKYDLKVEEMDVSITCQYSGNQVKIPTRSESCGISCLVDKEAIV
jgi:hypothetical protein